MEVIYMKKMLLWITAILTVCILSGCTNDKDKATGLVQIDFETLEQFINGEKDGFLIPTQDIENIKPEYIKNALENNKDVTIYLYNTYQPEGKDGKKAEKQQYGYGSKMPKNELYYLSNGEVIENLDLGKFEGTELTKQIEHFLEVHSER